MTDHILLIEKSEGIATVTLNRPEAMNALSRALRQAIVQTFHALRDDPEAGVVILTGAGRAFCAGLDLKELGSGTSDDTESTVAGADVVQALTNFPRPIIGAINGFAITGGFELALACDFRIADRAATFGLPEVEIGILPSSGGTMRLVKAIGAARAKELILLRRRLPAASLAEMGLVSEVVDGDPEPRALAVAAELAALPRLAVELAKKAADAATDASREAALLIEQLAYAALAEAGATRQEE